MRSSARTELERRDIHLSNLDNNPSDLCALEKRSKSGECTAQERAGKADGQPHLALLGIIETDCRYYSLAHRIHELE